MNIQSKNAPFTNLPDSSEFERYASNYQQPITGWSQLILLIAGAYNILFGLWAIFLPQHYFALNGLPPINTNLWQCIGMIVGLYGLGYIIAASDISRYWPLIFIGLLGKLFGPIGFVFSLFSGESSLSGAVIILFNDVVWWLPFAFVLTQVRNRNWRKTYKITAFNSSNTVAQYQHIKQLTSEGKVLLVFIRHFGCTFCQEALTTLATEYEQISAENIRVVIVHMGPEKKLAEYLDAVQLQSIEHIEDKSQVLFSFFGVDRANLCQVVSPAIVTSGLRAIGKDKVGVGMLAGDGFQLAASILINEDRILKTHYNRDVSNNLSYAKFVKDNENILDSSNGSKEKVSPEITLYYDGDCPLCKIEIDALKSLTLPGKVDYEDISDSEFNEQQHGKSCDLLMREIHARDHRGNWLVGMEAFRGVYAFTPYAALFNLTRLTLIKPIFDAAYKFFAKNRLRLTGRDSNCNP